VFWLGTDRLFTEAAESITWFWTPHEPGHEHEAEPLTGKIFWFRAGYDHRTEPFPKIKITGRRLDGPTSPVMVHYTHAVMGPTSSMLTGVYVPTPGCWEITGDYEGDKVSFVVWVKPLNRANQ
jgi:hypothetical protein